MLQQSSMSSLTPSWHSKGKFFGFDHGLPQFLHFHSFSQMAQGGKLLIWTLVDGVNISAAIKIFTSSWLSLDAALTWRWRWQGQQQEREGRRKWQRERSRQCWGRPRWHWARGGCPEMEEVVNSDAGDICPRSTRQGRSTQGHLPQPCKLKRSFVVWIQILLKLSMIMLWVGCTKMARNQPASSSIGEAEVRAEIDFASGTRPRFVTLALRPGIPVQHPLKYFSLVYSTIKGDVTLGSRRHFVRDRSCGKHLQ